MGGRRKLYSFHKWNQQYLMMNDRNDSSNINAGQLITNIFTKKKNKYTLCFCDLF